MAYFSRNEGNASIQWWELAARTHEELFCVLSEKWLICTNAYDFQKVGVAPNPTPNPYWVELGESH